MSGMIGLSTNNGQSADTTNTTVRVPTVIADALDEEARRNLTSRASVMRKILVDWALSNAVAEAVKM